MWHHEYLPLVPICGIFCLSNVFTKWFTWSLLIIIVSKCKAFDIRKYGRKSIQFKPYLRTNNELIPPVKINESFFYLGKQYSFGINPGKIKDTMDVIDSIPLHLRNKMMIVARYDYSKLRWNLSIYLYDPKPWLDSENIC